MRVDWRAQSARMAVGLGVALATALMPAPAALAAPSNDDRANPFAVNLAWGALTVGNTTATVEPGELLTPLGAGTCDGVEDGRDYVVSVHR